MTSNDEEVEVVSRFDYLHERVYMLRMIVDGQSVVFFRNDKNEHLSLGNESFYCSGVRVKNKPKRLHKAIYDDGSVDDDWYPEDHKHIYTNGVIGYINKTGDKVTIELV